MVSMVLVVNVAGGDQSRQLRRLELFGLWSGDISVAIV